MEPRRHHSSRGAVDSEDPAELSKQLRATRRELEKSKKRLARNDELEQQHDTLEKEIVELRAALRDAKKRETDAAKKNDMLRVEIRKSSAEDALRSPRQVKAKDSDDMAKEMKELRELVAVRDKELERQSRGLKKVEQLVATKESLIQALQKSQGYKENQLLDAQQKTRELEEVVATLRAEIDVLKSTDNKGGGMNLADELGGSFGDHPDPTQEKLDRMAAKLENETKLARDMVRKVETQNKQLIARKDELKAQLATATAKAHAARKVEELNARLVARNEVLESSLKSASGGANSNEGVEQRVQEQLLECTQRINALSKEKRRLQAKVRAQTQQIEMLHKNLNSKGTLEPDETPAASVESRDRDEEPDGSWMGFVYSAVGGMSEPIASPAASAASTSNVEAQPEDSWMGFMSPAVANPSGTVERKESPVALAASKGNAETEPGGSWLGFAYSALANFGASMQDMVDRHDVAGVREYMQTCADENELIVGRRALKLWAAEELFDAVEETTAGNGDVSDLHRAIEEATKYGANQDLIYRARQLLADRRGMG